MRLTDETKISICIPAYNDAEAFSRALNSVLMQDYTNFECIISDDSSTYDIESFVAAKLDPRLIYIRNTPALGVPNNWNAAFSRAQGPIYTLLHQDDFYCGTEVFRAIVDGMAKSKAQIAVCGRCTWRDGQLTGKYIRHEKQVRKFLRQYPQRSLVVNRIGHPSVIFFHKACRHILFDPELHYFLDTEWYSRLWQCAQNIVYVPHALVGIEFGRTLQLSQKCVEDLPAIVHELHQTLEKSKATSMQCVQAYARLTASHIRHVRPNNILNILRTVSQHLSSPQKIILYTLLVFFLGHMGYRLLYKTLLRRSWG